MQQAGITTDVVAERPVGITIAAAGRVAFSDSHVAHVFTPVTGRVTSVLVSVGQHVRRGAALAIVQSPDLASAVADLRKADADLSAATRDFDRQKELIAVHA